MDNKQIHLTISVVLILLLRVVNSKAYIIDSERHGRIVGGDIVKIENAPFIVALEFDRHHICGGAVVNERWVVTAAHCFGLRFNTSRAVIRSGSDERGRGGSEHQVVSAFRHPLFVYTKVEHDVGLIKVDPPFIYSATVQPIALPQSDVRPEDGDLTTVYGWGYTKETGEPSINLRGVVLPVYPYEDCASIYNATIRITRKMLCAGYRDGGRDACVFDSGGPLIWRKVLHGLVSWGWGCARAFRPGVYTAISEPEVRNWIIQVIGGDERNSNGTQINIARKIQLARGFGIKVDRSLLNSKINREFY